MFKPHTIAWGTLLALIIGADIALRVELIAVAASHKLSLLFLRQEVALTTLETIHSCLVTVCATLDLIFTVVAGLGI